MISFATGNKDDNDAYLRQVQLVVDMVEVFEQLIGAVANDGALSITIKVPD